MKLDVCLSLKLIDNYELDNTTIVIIDVVRASSTICTAIDCGVEHIVALSDVEETRKRKNEGYIISGERNGCMIEGFDYGNSPLSYKDESTFKGAKLAITTTNGTRTLNLVEKASNNFTNCDVLIGAFVNSSSIKNYILSNSKNVLLVCSGWKANLSIEDTIFAGKLAQELLETGNYSPISDGAAHATLLYNIAANNLYDFVLDNSARFKGKPGSLHKDIRYCLQHDILDVVPILKDGKIQLATSNK